MTAVTLPATESRPSTSARIAAAIVIAARAATRPFDPRPGRGQLGVPREIELGRITGGRI